MNDIKLIKWLRDNSAGSYRPSGEAADRIEELLTEVSELKRDSTLFSTQGTVTGRTLVKESNLKEADSLLKTDEQLSINAFASRKNNLKIQALAGTGKTSTTVMVAETLRGINSLYVSYTKAIAEEAKLKFPTWVECKTLHSLAWYSIVRNSGYSDRIKPFINRKDILGLFPELKKLTPVVKAKTIGTITIHINTFCNSAEASIHSYLNKTNLTKSTCKLITLLWNELVDENSSIGLSHNVYFKLFQLSKPILHFDVIYVDECQDLNGASLDILMNQKCQMIFVGDINQNIFGFNDTVDSFSMLDTFKELTLSKSFRFNQTIADTANKVLTMIESPNLLEGTYTGTNISTRALLVRTNLDLFTHLHKYASNGLKSYPIGDLAPLFNQLQDAYKLKHSTDLRSIRDKAIASYDTWEELIMDCEYTTEMRKVVSIIDAFPNLNGAINTIRTSLVNVSDEAYITVCTAHKCKGLEFDSVEVADGFIPWTDTRDFKKGNKTAKDIMNDNDTGKLIYMAITRGKVETNLPYSITQLLE